VLVAFGIGHQDREHGIEFALHFVQQQVQLAFPDVGGDVVVGMEALLGGLESFADLDGHGGAFVAVALRLDGSKRWSGHGTISGGRNKGDEDVGEWAMLTSSGRTRHPCGFAGVLLHPFAWPRIVCMIATPDFPASSPASPPASSPAPTPQALAGLRVVELGQLIAGPFAGKTLADFGADVVKIEPPGRAPGEGGDPLRQWRLLHEGTSVWWQVQSRNKKSVVLDLRTPQGRELACRLIDEADVLIENFKPGTLEKWGMGPEALSARNPGLIMLRISGYGQSGPYRERPGFAVVAEAMGGMRHLNGEPGRMPVRAGVSLGDTLAALHGVIG